VSQSKTPRDLAFDGIWWVGIGIAVWLLYQFLIIPLWQKLRDGDRTFQWLMSGACVVGGVIALIVAGIAAMSGVKHF
jgi:hypothetical protein